MMVTLKCTVLLTLALGAAAEPKSVAHSEIGRGVTFYKDLARGVALTAEFASGSEGDVALKWKGRDGDIAYDASLAMPASGPLGSMAASASAKRGAMKLSLATDMARPHLPKSLALEWVTTKTKLPKELTGGGKLTLTPTLRPRMMESKGFLAAADCKAKIELNGPKAVAELTMSPRMQLSNAKLSFGISDADRLALSQGAIQLTRSLPEDGAEVSLALKASKAGDAPVLDVAWSSPRDPYGGWKLKMSSPLSDLTSTSAFLTREIKL